MAWIANIMDPSSMDHVREIVNALLDRYERSAHYRGTAATGRRVSFPVRPGTIPAYFDDSTARFKSEINQGCRMLEERGIVRIRWVKHERGNLIDRVDLDLGNVAAAYAFADRTPKEDHVARISRLIEAYRDGIHRGQASCGQGGAEWLLSFFDYISRRLSCRESVARYLDIGDPVGAENILKVLEALPQLGEEVTKRTFSTRVLGDSKEFARIEGRILAILRDFCPGFGASLDDPREGLAEFGLVDTPQYIYLSGELRIRVKRDAGGQGNGIDQVGVVDHGSAVGRGRPVDQWNVVDLGGFVPDVGLPSSMAESLEIIELDADYVITIENLTSYHEFLKANPGHRDSDGKRYLAVYLGGYHNRPRRELLSRIYRCKPLGELEFYHWGDLDYGGFSIFVHLRRSLGINLKPYLMDRATLERYERFAKPLPKTYAARLARLLSDPEFRCFHPVIEYMLEKGIRLEQEAVRPGSVCTSFRLTQRP